MNAIELPRMTESDERRFAAKVGLPDDRGCMPWLASTLPNGYGRFHLGAAPVYAHRVSYHHFIGAISPGMEVDHLCHVRHCVAPDHLRAVTHAQNCQNRSGAQPKSRSGVRGVYWAKKDRRWRALGKIDGRSHHIGSFLTKEEAEAAATAWRAENMPHSVLDAPTVTYYGGHGIGHVWDRPDVAR